MGSIGQKSTLFQKSINTNQQRLLYRDNMRGSRNFLSRGGGGGGGGGHGSSTYFTVYIQRGSNGFITHFPGGSTCSMGGGGVQMLISIETHITINCDFPGGGGVWTPYPPPLDPHMGNVAFWHESVWPPFKLRTSKC